LWLRLLGLLRSSFRTLRLFAARTAAAATASAAVAARPLPSGRAAGRLRLLCGLRVARRCFPALLLLRRTRTALSLLAAASAPGLLAFAAFRAAGTRLLRLTAASRLVLPGLADPEALLELLNLPVHELTRLCLGL
jgi:hypothetical protein